VHRRNRDINIFSVSVLDLFASGMGVFALLAVILFPYYLKSGAVEDSDNLKSSFLAVVVQWTAKNHDVDLHVINPRGEEFFFQANNQDGTHFPDVQALLTVDSQNGPGAEVWLDPRPLTGRYEIFATLYDRHDNPNATVLKGKIYHRDGAIQLPIRMLNRERRRVKLGDIDVDKNGNVTFTPVKATSG
jgi:hypothetical protein